MGACALTVTACAVGAGKKQYSSPEEELAQRSADLQRSMQQAALAGFLGTGGVYVFGGAKGGPAVGIIGAIPVAVATGTYVGYLQQQYQTNEERRQRLLQDIALTKAESDAALQTMREVSAPAAAAGSRRAVRLA